MMFQVWQVAAVYLKACASGPKLQRCHAVCGKEEDYGISHEVCRQSVRPSQAVLPTALGMPEDAALAARRIDALIVGVLTVGPVGGMPTRHRY